MFDKALFSVVTAVSAMTISGLAVAAGPHSGGHAQPTQQGQHMQHEPHGQHDGQHMQGEQGHSQGSHESAEAQHMHGSDAMDHHSDSHAEVNGRPGDPAKVTRVIDMTMDDTMRFTPDRVTVKAGETVRFFLKNIGRVSHEFVIGPMDELREHAEMMRRMPKMKHEEPNQITLAPRQIGGVVWQFDRPGTVDFACLIPGHFEAGMVGKVQVR